ncbi:MAG: Bax inhibitor-1/YccA family protein [Lachnospiraceae bacterium]|nr:Bax inhibitor-1/YccA family protein [Lachnospiraceae bacterium]
MSEFDKQYSTYDNNVFEHSNSIDLNTFIAKTFLWMGVGLAVTFAAAFALFRTGTIYRMLMSGGSGILIVAAILQIGVVLFLGVRLQKMSVTAARVCFLAYAALTGIDFSIFFVAYDFDILIYAFGLTAFFFGGMAFLTLKLKLDVSGIGKYLFCGLIFMLVVGLIGGIAGIGWTGILTAWIGIAVFIGYTAYDTQMIVRQYHYYAGNTTILEKASVFAALQLYLDFINLLMRIVRILANSKSRD